MSTKTMDLNTLIDLYHHMHWADGAVWVSVLACEGAQTDAKLKEYLTHLHMVQRVFLRVWRGEDRITEQPALDDLQSVMRWGRAYYEEAFAHLATLSEEKLSETLPLPWASMLEQQMGRPPAATTVGETALQVVMHTLYHRGQVNAFLRQLGGEPPLVDYIAWVWMGRPAPAWPEGAA